MDYIEKINSEGDAICKASEDVSIAYHSSSVKPYTYEELNSRIDEAERQIESGEIMSGEQVHKEILCIFTDEEYKEEIKLSEQSSNVSNDDVIKELQSWGFAM